MRPTRIIGMLPTGMPVVDRTALDDIQPEVVVAVLDLKLVTDELRRRGEQGASSSRAERQVGEVDPRVPAAEVDHIHRQNLARKLFAECRKPIALRQHLCRKPQETWCRFHTDLLTHGAPNGGLPCPYGAKFGAKL